MVLEGWEGQKSRCQSEVRTAELMCFVGSFKKKLLPQSGLFTLLSSPTAAKSIFRESAPWRRHLCPQTLVAGDTQDEKWHMTLFHRHPLTCPQCPFPVTHICACIAPQSQSRDCALFNSLGPCGAKYLSHCKGLRDVVDWAVVQMDPA